MINTELTKLPKRWYIIWENKENYQVIQDWLKTNWIYADDELHSNAGQTFDNKYVVGNKSRTKIVKDYTEISFEQFKKWIMKEKPLKTNTECAFIIKLLKKYNIK